MKKVSLFSAVLAAALVFPIAGAAQQPAPQAEARTGEARGERMQRPKLTDAQRDAIRKLHEAQREIGQAARKELRELHAQLAKELSAAQLNSGRVNDLKGRIAQKQSAVTAARIDQRAKVAALLTPEQRQAMGELDERMNARGPRGMRGAAGTRGMRGPQGMRGHGMRGGAMRGPHGPGAQFRRGGQIGRGAPGARGQMMMRQRGGGGNDAQLRQRIEKLERELEELRKKIG